MTVVTDFPFTGMAHPQRLVRHDGGDGVDIATGERVVLIEFETSQGTIMYEMTSGRARALAQLLHELARGVDALRQDDARP